MSEKLTDKTRISIMTKFLRTLVWIDDEIRPDKADKGGDPFRNFFFPTAQEFQRNGLLVHLHPFESESSSGEENIFDEAPVSLVSATTLAKKADVVILDWHLGRNDPEHSIQLLKNLNDEPAIRYIVVLSMYADDFEREIASNGLINQTGSSDNASLVGIGGSWANARGTHIIVMKKPNDVPYDAIGFCDSVIEKIYHLMSKANPDYLHWAAIEIAAKMRHSIPDWVRSIPRGTDAAVLSELMSENSEARDFIPEHLLEDLSNLARLNVLESLNQSNCAPGHWLHPLYEIQSQTQHSQRSEKFVHFSLSAAMLEGADVNKIRKNSHDEPTRKFLNSQRSFTEFCENLSSCLDSYPTFGSLYVKNEAEKGSIVQDDLGNGEQRIIYLCLSQECDALRGTSLLFLIGRSANPSSTRRDGVTMLSFQGEEFEFLPEARSLQTVDVVKRDGQRILEGYKKIGQVRKATARRIINRYWSHMSRSAVNLSRFALKDRDRE